MRTTELERKLDGRAFRGRVPELKEDREMAADLKAAREFLDGIDEFLEDLL